MGRLATRVVWSSRPVALRRGADSSGNRNPSRIFTSWNQTTAWLTQVEGLRRAA